MISPDKRSIYIYEEVKGPEKDKLLIRRLSPDDRQPGARDRQALYRYDIATGVYEPVLYGHRSVSLLDFSADGSQLLLGLYTRTGSTAPSTRRQYCATHLPRGLSIRSSRSSLRSVA